MLNKEKLQKAMEILGDVSEENKALIERATKENIPEKELFEKLEELLDFLIPLYIHEGKSQLVIAFGCTGGKHRSITFAELMAARIAEKGYKVQKYHRDITKDK